MPAGLRSKGQYLPEWVECQVAGKPKINKASTLSGMGVGEPGTFSETTEPSTTIHEGHR